MDRARAFSRSNVIQPNDTRVLGIGDHTEGALQKFQYPYAMISGEIAHETTPFQLWPRSRLSQRFANFVIQRTAIALWCEAREQISFGLQPILAVVARLETCEE